MNLDAFPQFWQAYPRKVGKKDALKAWSKLTPEHRLEAMEAIGHHCKYWDACRTEKEFIPHASTWLNSWRFQDEIDIPKPKENWKLSDQTILAKAHSLGIYTQGKYTPQLIREIEERI